METDNAEAKKGIYQVSGLTYNLPKLIVTIGLVLMGYVAFSFCVGHTPTIVNLRLKELGISSTLMVFITTTISQIFNMTVCQWVSFKSDRYRSKKWGRRVPFILFTMPMMCLAWLIIGFYEEESLILGKLLSPLVKLPPATLMIIMIAFGFIMFRFFYMFVGSVFFYIYNDVIPPQIMTRFFGIVQITGTVTATVYNFFLFKHVMTHFKIVMIVFVVIYVILMGAMCFLLREPRFPEPEPEEKKKSKGLAGIFSFGKECFSHRLYWYMFLDTAFAGASTLTLSFVVFHEQSMGLSLADIGEIGGWSGSIRTVMGFIAAAFGAVLIDRWHPVRVAVFFRMFLLCAVCCETRWFFFTPQPQVYWWSHLLYVLFVFLNLFTGIAGMPYLQMMMPKSRFGQFCSARSLVSSCAGLLFGLLLGIFLDYLRYDYGLGLGDRSFRGIYLWQIFFSGIGLFFCLLAFREYRDLGGFSGFRAPAIWEASGFEKMEVSQTPPPSIPVLKWVLRGFDLLFLISVVCAAVMVYFCRKNGYRETADAYLCINIPVTVGVFLFWCFIRTKIYLNISKILNGGSALIPHHGILLMALIMRVLFQIMFFVESWMTLELSGSETGAYLNIYANAIDVLFISAVWLCMKLEEPCILTKKVEA